MKTGRDIAIATLLGAEEWGLATAALVVEGCIMMRKCHLNTCPVGVATQDPELRNRFKGDPAHIVNFFKMITQELREIMAELGFRTINEMVGQVDNLEMREGMEHWKYKNLDLTAVLYKAPHSPYTGLFCSEEQDHGLAESLDWKLLETALPAIEHQEKITGSFNIKNTDRTVGTILSNEITKKYRAAGLPDNTIHFNFKGTAGQSFGAFNTKGITLELEGDANDYFGKGLSGAKLIIYPSKLATYTPEDNSIIGNVAFYGATSGEAYIRGKAGERFAVRNSGAHVVVESVGDHGCEYMTGGQVIILGDTGRNFAAGMSGGIAYVYDVKGRFADNCNREMVDLDECGLDDKNELFTMIRKHYEYTGSTVAKFIIDDLDNQLHHFVKVFPKDYKKVLNRRREEMQEEGKAEKTSRI
jgi:glutamate synthase (NADPH/NADH) large chain